MLPKHSLVLLVATVMLASCATLSESYAELQIEPLETNKKSLDLITISGIVGEEVSSIIMIIEFPDGTTKDHTVRIGKDGVFVYYINPRAEFPSGTYLVNVHSVYPKMKLLHKGAFNIHDTEKSFDFVISRGASAKTCDGCITPAKTTILEQSPVTFYNDDSAIHDIQNTKKSKKPEEIIGMLSPGESRSAITVIGKNNYQCTIHPWIYSEMTIIKDKFDFIMAIQPKEIPEDITKDITKDTPEDITKDTPEDITKDTPEDITKDTPEELSEPIPCVSCFGGIVTKVVDGDTLDIDHKRIRLALVNTPERGDTGYRKATTFVKNMCPVGSVAFYDVDLGQPIGSYGRTIAEVWCGGISLNQQLVEKNLGVINKRYCNTSQFAEEPWAAPCNTSFKIIPNETNSTESQEFTESGNSNDVLSEIIDKIIPDKVIPGEIIEKTSTEKTTEIPYVVDLSDPENSNPFTLTGDIFSPVQMIVAVAIIFTMIVMYRFRKRS